MFKDRKKQEIKKGESHEINDERQLEKQRRLKGKAISWGRSKNNVVPGKRRSARKPMSFMRKEGANPGMSGKIGLKQNEQFANRKERRCAMNLVPWRGRESGVDLFDDLEGFQKR